MTISPELLDQWCKLREAGLSYRSIAAEAGSGFSHEWIRLTLGPDGRNAKDGGRARLLRILASRLGRAIPCANGCGYWALPRRGRHNATTRTCSPACSAAMTTFKWINARRASGPPSSPKKQAIAQSYVNGWSLAAAGERHGVSSAYVAFVLREFGIPRRPKGTRYNERGRVA